MYLQLFPQFISYCRFTVPHHVSIPSCEHGGAVLTHGVGPQLLQQFALCNGLICGSSQHAINPLLQEAAAALLRCCLLGHVPQLPVICVWHTREAHSKPGDISNDRPGYRHRCWQCVCVCFTLCCTFHRCVRKAGSALQSPACWCDP